MLEFIVLGIIPGTSVQITFAQVLLVAGILLLASEARIMAGRKHTLRVAQSVINQLSL